MFQTFDQLPDGKVQGSGHAEFLPPLHDRSVHEIHLGLPAGKYILQHTGLVFAGRVGGFHHHLFGIVVQFDAKSFGDGETFVNERAEQLASWWKK